MQWKKKRKIYKKIVKMLGKTVATVLLLVVFLANQAQLLDAYEAHVINVTAKIKDYCPAGYSISGMKFNDKNKNQQQDPGEAGLEGWIIVLNKGPLEPQYDYDDSGYVNGADKAILQNVVNNTISCPAGKDCDINDDTALDVSDVLLFTTYINDHDLGSTQTASDGTYSFIGDYLTQGSYIIYEVMQNNWTNSTPKTQYINNLECGNNIIKFGNFQGEETPICGDGKINLPAEECDDGNIVDGDGCSAQCKPEVCAGQITLDFDKDGLNNPISRGQFIDNEYLPYGISVAAHNYNAAHPQKAITFDSASPTGNINGDHIKDVDLGTPNTMFGGPGLSETGDNTEPSNSLPLHNLLIIPDNVVDTTPADGYVDDPNDEPAGGSLRFIFDREYTFSSVKYIDLDHSTGEVVGYSDATGTAQIFSIPVPKGKGNSVQTITGDETTKIRYLKLRGNDSYAVDEIKLCPVLSCGNAVVDQGEQCDDGNKVDGDGCDNTCKVTNYCGDGILQSPNSFGETELCDDGVANGTKDSQCTLQCIPKAGQCNAKSPGYYRNNDGCSNGSGSSIWASQVNALSDSFFDVFKTMTGSQMCVTLANSCNSGTDVEKARCRATWHLLADEMDAVSSHLRPDALVAGADDGNFAFDALGITATTTISQAMTMVEQVISNANSTKDDLNRAQYVASRIYGWYENNNPTRPECVLPGMGNGIAETGEECDDGNLIPWDGCSPLGKKEVVLNEILPNPTGSDNAPKPDGEWVELYNNSPKPVSLKDWALYDNTDSHELLITDVNTDLATTTIPALGRLVVYRDASTIFVLTNNSDSVRLLNKKISSGGSLIDSFTWTSEKGEGLSYARVPDGTGDWVDPCPTPGEENNENMCPEELLDLPPVLLQDTQAVAEEPEAEISAEPLADAASFPDTYWDELMDKEFIEVLPEISEPATTVTEDMSQEAQNEETATSSDSTLSEAEPDGNEDTVNI